MTQNNHARRAFQPGFARMAALVLTALTLCAALLVPQAQAADWMQPYLEQVQDWGVMRGDANGNLNEDRSITRAEFVTLVNRAFGYTDVGPNPFSDVDDNAWYAEDICIAHQAGYFQGSSDSTASPMELVTREQAAVFLGRCLRFQGVTGAANSTFTDMEAIGGWSRGMVQEAAELGIIQGYPDGSFRPGQPITRGQMACFLVRALGTLIQEPGEQTSGGVYGNLTITTPGVKLKDTTVTGNLYLTGGVGLGDVELENVNVLGKIILTGGGQAEGGQHSVILRNVTAASLEVDSLTDQFLSVMAEGLTNIETTSIRSSAYVEDRTDDGLGLLNLRLDGDEGDQFQLAGNIKRVVNLTPGSELKIAQGVADVVTIDEKALESTLSIDNIANIRELNLDTATEVTGEGSISHLNVNAPDTSVSMLPDTIYVRPGLTSNVNRVDMDNKTANESSEDPRLLAGYPAARNIAPTSADAVFRTNKAGTIRWALTALMDGSVGEEELLNPSAYPKIIRSGSINATASNTDFTARLTGLTREGSYYISALVEDARGRRSPVKVAAFTTPDDTAPNFASGYPQAPIITVDSDGEQVAQIMVMPTKDCQLYYVLLPRGSTAPTAADFRAGALPGSLGSGVVTVRKNTPFLISRINTSHLQEKTNYDLYLWLNDADNGKSSAVRRVQLTTNDITPPTIQRLTVKTVAARSVQMSFALDEPGTFYWAVVKQGAPFYASGIDKNDPNLTGKIQIENGTGSNVVRRGGPIRASRAGTDYSFTVNGLEPQTTYDLYYVAKDTAGNYCVYSKTLTPPMTINTLDNEAPTVTQEFSNDSDGSSATSPTPYPDSTVTLVFSESVVPIVQNSGTWELEEPNFETAYQAAQGGDAARQLAFANLLKEHIKLYRRPSTGRDVLVTERTAANETDTNWVIDYRNATVSRDADTGTMSISFPYNSAINLGSGETYYFVVSNIADTSDAHNRMAHNNKEGFKLPEFSTVDAQLLLSPGDATGIVDGQSTVFDMNFRITPQGTNNVNSDVLWDMIVWADETLAFDLYCDDGSGWTKLGSAEILTNAQQSRTGISITNLMLGSNNGIPNFERLNQVSGVRNYGIMITRRGDSTDRATWFGDVDLTIVPVAGDLNSLTNLAGKNLTPSSYAAHQASNYAVREIGSPTREYTVSKTFSDTEAPTFIQGYPYFNVTDTSVSIDIMVSRRNSKYFCIVTELGNIPTQVDNIAGYISSQNWSQLPQNGEGMEGAGGNASAPSTTSVTQGDTYVGPRYLIDNGSCGSNVTTISFSDSLTPDAQYIAYFVLQGDSPTSASRVYAFRFETPVVSRPVLQAMLSNPSVNVQSVTTAEIAGGTQKDATVSYLVINTLQMGEWLNRKMSDYWDTTYAEAMGIPARSLETARANYENFTFAEAMGTTYTYSNENMGSVFDLFCSPTTQEQVGNWIRMAQSNGTTILKVGVDALSLSRSNQWGQSVNCANDLRGQSGQYWFIAVGRGSGSAYAFTAARYLTDPNVTHPVVSSSIIEADSYATREEAAAALAASGISGTLSISFDGPIYYAQNGSKLLQVIDTSSNSVGTLGDYIASSLVIQNTSPNVQLTPVYGTNFDTSNPPQCFGLNFRVTNAKEGATIRFDQYLANQNGQFGNDSLVFSLQIIQDNSRRWRPAFVVTTNGWDTDVKYF